MITVITTFYKGNAYIPGLLRMLRENVASLRSHGIEEAVEYIIVNDSPWERVRLPESMPDTFTLRIVDNPENLGIHRSRVAGIRACGGEYITILDQDDEIKADFLLSQYQMLGDGDVVVCNGVKEMEGYNRPIYRDRLKMSLVNRKTVYLMAANQIVSPGQCMLRKSRIPKAWLENPMLTNGSDDLFLWLLYFGQNTRFVLNYKSLYVHKQVGDNLSNSLEKMCQSDAEMCRIARSAGLLPEKDIRKRLRMCAFLRECGYRNKGSLMTYLKYPDIAFMKLFAYYI